MIATLVIRRGGPADPEQWQEFRVPYASGQSVLDALRRIRADQDPSLAVRYACLNANACKECMIEVDGRVAYACTVRLTPIPLRLGPLSNKPLIRDLVTDLVPSDER